MNEATEPPIEWTRVIAAVIITLALLIPAPVDADTDTARVSYYGLGDGYLWKRHAASWWGQTPEGWPEVVDLKHHGIATSDWSIPFGAVICFKIDKYPEWSEDEYADQVGTIACGVVVDRLPWRAQFVYGECYDVWPALALALMGPDFRRVGTVGAEVEICSVQYPRSVRGDGVINGLWGHR